MCTQTFTTIQCHIWPNKTGRNKFIEFKKTHLLKLHLLHLLRSVHASLTARHHCIVVHTHLKMIAVLYKYVININYFTSNCKNFFHQYKSTVTVNHLIVMSYTVKLGNNNFLFRMNSLVFTGLLFSYVIEQKKGSYGKKKLF